jgi:hypothetical protein
LRIRSSPSGIFHSSATFAIPSGICTSSSTTEGRRPEPSGNGRATEQTCPDRAPAHTPARSSTFPRCSCRPGRQHRQEQLLLHPNQCSRCSSQIA